MPSSTFNGKYSIVSRHVLAGLLTSGRTQMCTNALTNSLDEKEGDFSKYHGDGAESRIYAICTRPSTNTRCCCCYFFVGPSHFVSTDNEKVIARYSLHTEILNRSLQSIQNWSSACSVCVFFIHETNTLSFSLSSFGNCCSWILGLVNLFRRVCCECASEELFTVLWIERVHATQTNTCNSIIRTHQYNVLYTHKRLLALSIKCYLFACARTRVHVNVIVLVCCCCIIAIHKP